MDVLESGGDCVQRSELEMRRAETDAEDAEHEEGEEDKNESRSGVVLSSFRTMKGWAPEAASEGVEQAYGGAHSRGEILWWAGLGQASSTRHGNEEVGVSGS